MDCRPGVEQDALLVGSEHGGLGFIEKAGLLFQEGDGPFQAAVVLAIALRVYLEGPIELRPGELRERAGLLHPEHHQARGDGQGGQEQAGDDPPAELRLPGGFLESALLQQAPGGDGQQAEDQHRQDDAQHVRQPAGAAVRGVEPQHRAERQREAEEAQVVQYPADDGGGPASADRWFSFHGLNFRRRFAHSILRPVGLSPLASLPQAGFPGCRPGVASGSLLSGWVRGPERLQKTLYLQPAQVFNPLMLHASLSLISLRERHRIRA